MRWMIRRLLLEGAATGLEKRTSEPHPDARTHAILAPSNRQRVGWSRTGASSSTPRQTSLRTAQPIPALQALPAGKRAGTEGARPRPRSHWLRRHHLDKAALSSSRCAGVTAGLALPRPPATRASPDDPRGAATMPGPSPPLPPKHRGPPSRQQPWLYSRSRDWTRGLTAVQHPFPSTAGAEEALPKSREQSLVEATGGGGRTWSKVGRWVGTTQCLPSEGCTSGFDPGSALVYEVTLGQFLPFLGPRFPSVKSRPQ